MSELNELKASWILVIPTYNRSNTIEQVLEGLINYCDQILVIDAGSSDDTVAKIQKIAKQFPKITLLTNNKRKGKGFCLKTGLQLAKSQGYDYAITFDSDGQCNPAEIPHFLAEIKSNPNTLLVGERRRVSASLFNPQIVHKFSNLWFQLLTDIKLNDTQSAFRLYPLKVLSDMKYHTSGYEFELESLVFPAWKKVAIKNISITLNPQAPQTIQSNFRPIKDSYRVLVFNLALVVITFLWIWPLRIIRALSLKNIQLFIRSNITHSAESNLKIALSVSFGIFMGLMPVWGYQMIITGVVSHFCKLNKVLALTSSNLSLPFIIPFVLYAGCSTGAYLMGKSDINISDISFGYIQTIWGQYLLGSVVFATLLSSLCGVLIFTILSCFKKNK